MQNTSQGSVLAPMIVIPAVTFRCVSASRLLGLVVSSSTTAYQASTKLVSWPPFQANAHRDHQPVLDRVLSFRYMLYPDPLSLISTHREPCHRNASFGRQRSAALPRSAKMSLGAIRNVENVISNIMQTHVLNTKINASKRMHREH